MTKSLTEKSQVKTHAVTRRVRVVQVTNADSVPRPGMYVMGLKSRCTFFVVPRPESGTRAEERNAAEGGRIANGAPKQAEPGGGCELILG